MLDARKLFPKAYAEPNGVPTLTVESNEDGTVTVTVEDFAALYPGCTTLADLRAAELAAPRGYGTLLGK